ncbi:hypothetical protein B5C34_01190 [Pacificimonas flava]|uniref:DUF2157 domain-containing protein n=2 Tax=Pacificimonas TaxID=1960290 RepID=A0A219B1J9_9SPHN|nr:MULTISPECIES: DUF2157 domain-containing protein [Pacificimonas]MBZ6378170.1 DUF2157 domain-containing protein [Pacificimonas aurantium]OWV32200.1 hypothetical protein B5C34_01190 [Pacificimonas flava]
MGIEDRLADWRQQGLIDSAAAEKIRAYEAERARPVWLWAMAGLGALALALGIVALIAANWQDIPKAVKLGVHALLLAAAAGTAWQAREKGWPWALEVALFLFAGLVLGGLALQAQIYQLSGDIWRLLMTWLGLSVWPLLLAGRTRLTAYAVTGMTVWAFASVAAAMDGSTTRELLAQGLAASVPWALVAVGALTNSEFAKGLREGGLTVLLPFASLVHLTWADRLTVEDAGANLVRCLPVLAVAAGATLPALRRGVIPKSLVAPLLLGPLGALLLATLIPHPDATFPRLAGVFVFAAMWIWIAFASARAGWRGLYGIAIAALAIRLFIVYFELFGTLATTGLGLIVAGLLLIGLAFAGRRMFREGAAG